MLHANIAHQANMYVNNIVARPGPCGIGSQCLLLCRPPWVGAQVISWWAFYSNSIKPSMLESLVGFVYCNALE